VVTKIFDGFGVASPILNGPPEPAGIRIKPVLQNDTVFKVGLEPVIVELLSMRCFTDWLLELNEPELKVARMM